MADYNLGWYQNPDEVAWVCQSLPDPYFASAARGLYGTGRGQTVMLYKAWKDVYGDYFPYPAQSIGCCVSRGWSEGVDLLQCVQIAVGHANEEFNPTSHEAIYGFARVDIGGGRLGEQDGAVGAWAAKAVSTIGTVSQKDVGFDYSDRKAKEWGSRGVPADIKSKAKDHIVKSVAMVKTFDELCDAIANGYPVPVCSNQGFTMERDRDGFCKPQGSWAHCMLICGIRDDKPGALIMQSWGMDNPKGPLALDQPPNSFWADADVVEKMLSEQDSFAMSSYVGYPGSGPMPFHWTLRGFF